MNIFRISLFFVLSWSISTNLFAQKTRIQPTWGVVTKDKDPCGDFCFRRNQEADIATHNKNLEILRDASKKEMIKITKWMNEMNFPIATAWKSGTSVDEWNENPVGQMEVRDMVRASGLESDKAKKGDLLNTTGGYVFEAAYIDLPISEFLDGKQQLSPKNVETLAHELSHGVHKTIGTNFVHKTPDENSDSPMEWITEGLPEAVGYAWTKHEYKSDGSDARDPHYDLKLYEPEDDYERGHFFLRMGEDLNGNELPMTYFPEILKNKIAGNGITWLDNYLKQTPKGGLKQYYPQFIAKWTSKSFFKNKGKNFPSLKIEIPSQAEKILEDIDVLDVAATYDELEVEFQPGNWEELEDKQRIYLLAVDIFEAERKSDLSLIVDKRIHPGEERDLSVVFAETGEMTNPLVTNVVNVADVAAKSEEQKFSLHLNASPISLDLPSCMKVGSESEIFLNGITTAEFSELTSRENGGIELKTTANDKNIKIGESIIFTAPSTAQRVKVTLMVPTIFGGKKKEVNLGEIQVQTSDCSIKITISADGDRATYIWDGNQKLLERPGSDPSTFVLIDHDSMYGYNSKGWTKHSSKAMVARFFKSAIVHVTPLDLSDMNTDGKILSAIYPDIFSWENMLLLDKERRQRFPKKEQMKFGKTACRTDPSKRCNTIEHPLKLEYDELNRLSEFIKLANFSFTFEYGNYSAHTLPAALRDNKE